MISPPVFVEPVNATLSTPGADEVRAGRRPVGRDDVDRAGREADLGASSASGAPSAASAGPGLRTTEQPAASAGASFQVAISSG
jgi:hypothetical protein